MVSHTSMFLLPLAAYKAVARATFTCCPQSALPLLHSTSKRHSFHTSATLRVIDDMTRVITTERLKALRERMKESSYDVYIVPSEDSHQSEYIAPADGRRQFISGFSGSAGTAVITQDKAALATDGRYFNQAANQLDDNWTLLKQGLEDVPTWQEWTADQTQGGKTVGIDSTVISAPEARKLSDKIKKKNGGQLKGSTTNLVDSIWAKDRPERPREKVQVQSEKYAGKSVKEKLEDLRKELDKKKGAGLIISMLDEVAWLYNLRGNDIPYNPVFFAYAIVTPTGASLYVDEAKFDKEVVSHLRDSVEVRPYDSIFDDVKAMYESSEAANAKSQEPGRKFMISTKASWALSQILGGPDKVDEVRSPVGDAKAIKNKVEIEGMKNCHIRDGTALTEYFAWLEDQLVNQAAELDEATAADKLEQIRSKHEHFVGLSFPTISSTGPNAAVIHYKPEHGSCAVINPKDIYLCDSGAQYLDGTTDTTRTIHFGTPKPEEIEAYTLVLKGVIAIDSAVYPKGANGLALDTLARQHLWQYGLDYRHGTGHGIGSYLNVHEGPIGIGTRVQYTEVPLSAGNVISNEPGYYEDGKFGIRIENVIVAKEVKPKYSFGEKGWLGFENVTMTPMCRRLIDTSLLTEAEKNWLNEFHTKVWDQTASYFEGRDERSLAWLKRETAKI